MSTGTRQVYSHKSLPGRQLKLHSSTPGQAVSISGVLFSLLQVSELQKIILNDIFTVEKQHSVALICNLFEAVAASLAPTPQSNRPKPITRNSNFTKPLLVTASWLKKK